MWSGKSVWDGQVGCGHLRVGDRQRFETLELLAKSYSAAALQTYNFSPEDISRMFLTMIELWIALDKLLVTSQIPMLTDYSPEILTSFFVIPSTSCDICRIASHHAGAKSHDLSHFQLFSSCLQPSAHMCMYPMRPFGFPASLGRPSGKSDVRLHQVGKRLNRSKTIKHIKTNHMQAQDQVRRQSQEKTVELA